MAMVIQHNLTAMNSNRQLGVITSGQAKSSEKLSSGYKINRAADDAAGLKISEKMRSQIRGLNKASSNAQDGVSLIQTAEGALNEAHSILQRMHELAVQGANDTNQDIDRDAINQELTALTDELDRISQTTQFNKQELLDGSFTDKNLHVGANANQKISISIEGMDAASIGLRNFVYFKGTDSVEYNHFTYAGVSYKYDPNKTDASNLLMFKEKVSEATDAMWSNGMIANGSDGQYYLSAGGTAYSTTASAVEDGKKLLASQYKVMASEAWSGLLENSKKITQTIGAFGSAVTFSAACVDDYDKANATLKAIQDAINVVSTQRSALGAIQNRLEHTIANLDNVSENTQAAESRIRDTDMASEMVEYSKNQILAQAGQSMLAQANQSTQGVLSLLQ